MNYHKRTLKQLNVMDDFLMNALASDPEVGVPFCRTILSVLLQRQIGEIRVVAQKVIPAVTPEKRGIRMDVMIEETVKPPDRKNAEMSEREADTNPKAPASEAEIPALHIYDLEPHIPDTQNLPRHNRFYQAKIDGGRLKSGVKDFGKLPELYIITLTNYDPFGYDYMMYTVENKCVELPELEYRDGLHFIYFYTKGSKGGSPEIRELLSYIRESTAKKATTEVTRKIHEYVEKVKTEPELEMEYMRFDELMAYTREEGFALGHEEGLAEGKTEGLAIGLKDGKAFGIIEILKKQDASDSQILQELQNGLSIPVERAQKYLDDYPKH